MKRLHKVFPLTASADQQTTLRILGGWWFKETAGSTAEVKLYRSALDDPSAPTAALNTDNTGAQITAGAHSYKVTYVTADGETEMSAASNSVTNDGTHTSNTVTIPVGPTGTTSRKVYRNKVATQTTWFLHSTVANNTATDVQDITPDASLGAAGPTTNTTGTMLFDIPLTANAYATLPTADMPIDCEATVWVESVSGAWTGALIGQ